MNFSTLLQTVSSYSDLLPFLFVITYFIKHGFMYDKRINILGFYFIISAIAQALMLYLALNAKPNLAVGKVFILCEAFILGYFLLNFQIKSFLSKISIAGSLTLVLFLVDLFWGEKNRIPVETILLESLTITILGMTTIPDLKVHSKHENSFYYFVFAIMVYSLNNLIGYGFIELAPGFSLTIHGIVNLIKNFIFAWGLVIVIRNNKND